MMGTLLREYEIMQNPALGANALWAFSQGFLSRQSENKRLLTLWHLVSILPLVYQETSRKMILKRREASGLRSILDRDIKNSIAQNEAVFDINSRLQAMEERTFRSLNIAITSKLISLEDGYFSSSLPFKLPKNVSVETKEVLKAAYKLGIWAGGMSDFEYLSVLGVEPLK
ncbi:three component ABC system middle component [Terrilactibacillus laevilacticus]|uniref:Three component ABC system middle component n=2 Tax=Terrilactibacillus laevilacticus TaxID=1380157 RepID=A0ABW5PNU3_9BACI